MREETRSDDRQPLSAISTTHDVNDPPVRGNFNVVYWWVELCFSSAAFQKQKNRNYYWNQSKFLQRDCPVYAIIGNKISKYFFLTSLSQILHICRRQTYTSGKFNSRDSAWYDLFCFSDTSGCQIITKEAVSRIIELSWQNTCLIWQTYFRSGQV